MPDVTHCQDGLNVSWPPKAMSLRSLILCLQLQKRRRQATAYRQKELGYNKKDTRLLLTTDDLADALREVRRLTFDQDTFDASCTPNVGVWL